MNKAIETPPFKIGDLVYKPRGSRWEGTVVAVYKPITKPTWHIVVECLAKEVEGAQQLYPTSVFELDNRAKEQI